DIAVFPIPSSSRIANARKTKKTPEEIKVVPSILFIRIKTHQSTPKLLPEYRIGDAP
ncbi:unnamed protein product, partial [Dovyalis caffra]